MLKDCCSSIFKYKNVSETKAKNHFDNKMSSYKNETKAKNHFDNKMSSYKNNSSGQCFIGLYRLVWIF